LRIIFLQKWHGINFGPIFSRTHPVTLVSRQHLKNGRNYFPQHPTMKLRLDESRLKTPNSTPMGPILYKKKARKWLPANFWLFQVFGKISKHVLAI
jgi:hypothetical protein